MYWNGDLAPHKSHGIRWLENTFKWHQLLHSCYDSMLSIYGWDSRTRYLSLRRCSLPVILFLSVENYVSTSNLEHFHNFSFLCEANFEKKTSRDDVDLFFVKKNNGHFLTQKTRYVDWEFYHLYIVPFDLNASWTSSTKDSWALRDWKNTVSLRNGALVDEGFFNITSLCRSLTLA